MSERRWVEVALSPGLFAVLDERKRVGRQTYSACVEDALYTYFFGARRRRKPSDLEAAKLPIAELIQIFAYVEKKILEVDRAVASGDSDLVSRLIFGLQVNEVLTEIRAARQQFEGHFAELAEFKRRSTC